MGAAILRRLQSWFASLRASLLGADRSTLALGAAGATFTLFLVLASVTKPNPIFAGIGIGLLYLVISGLVFLRSGFDRITVGILLGGLGLYLAYLGYTSYAERNYDGPAQLEYIQYIATNGRRPPSSTCLICHHPPLYYYLGAGVLLFFKKVNTLGQPTFGLQLLSLLFFTVFLVYAVKTIRRFTTNLWLVRLATALVVFWPYSIQMSVRVHNDALAGTAMMAAIYFIVRYYEAPSARDFWFAALWVAIGLLTKSSAYAVAAILFLIVALKFPKTPRKLRVLVRTAAASCVFVGAIVLAGLGRGAPPPTDDGGICRKFLGNACDIGRHQWVENTTYNYMYFDLKSFLKEPYLIAEKDGSGRELFWNDFAKTSLFGTNNTTADRETAYEFNRHIGGIMNGLVAAMSAFMLFGIAFVSKASAKRYGAIFITIGLLTAFMIAFRAMIPAPHHTDFRHVYAIVVPVSLLYIKVLADAAKRGQVLDWLGRGLAVSFVGLSIFYFLPKRELVMRLTGKVIPAQYSKYSKPVAEGTPWDKEPNLLFEENHTIEFTLGSKHTISEIEITLDNNDRYELLLFSGKDSKPRKVFVGPAGRKVDGLARYVRPVTPPAEGIDRVQLRALSGDQAYSMGHIIVR
jgi:hypothetical protein